MAKTKEGKKERKNKGKNMIWKEVEVEGTKESMQERKKSRCVN